MFLKKVSYAQQGCIYLVKKYNENCKIGKYYCNLKELFLFKLYFKMKFIPVIRSWIFIIITPVFSVTWSSEIILIWGFAAQETFLIIINVKNSCAAAYFCQIYFFVILINHHNEL